MRVKCITKELEHNTLREDYDVLLTKHIVTKILGKSNLDTLKIKYRIPCDDSKDRWLSSKNFVEVGE